MFEWDDDKAASNLLKHGVFFREAATICADRVYLFRCDSQPYAQLAQGGALIQLDPEVLQAFPNYEVVNAALRMLMETAERAKELAKAG